MLKMLVFIIFGLYIIFLLTIYFFQEHLLFHPVPAPTNITKLPEGIEEKFTKVVPGVTLHGLMFRAKNSKGLVFYLHGNGGNAYDWGYDAAQFFTEMGYDLFIPDYRGYGKSQGQIYSEKQLLDDMEKVYYDITKSYAGRNIIICGYSLGTGIATHLALNKNIKALILQAPYYSLGQLSDEKVPLVPDFIKKYTLNTYKWIPQITVPVYIFHGKEDALIPYQNTVKLSDLNSKIEYTLLEGTTHNGINQKAAFADKLQEILR